MKIINWRRLWVAVAVFSVIAAATFVIRASEAFPATEVALQAMRSDSQVHVSEEKGWIIFTPAADSHPETGLVFYPGTFVDCRAYAPVLKLIAARGYFVALVFMPLNLAVFDVNAADRVRAQYPEVRNWAVGGHSLGGTVAASYAADHVEIKGVVLWAAYPANNALGSMQMKAISIYGTADRIATGDKIEESRAWLPADAQFIPIQGGNHSQFGSYRLQPGDSDAGISPEEQWAQIAEATVEFLKDLK